MSYTLVVDCTKNPVFIEDDIYIDQLLKQEKIKSQISNRTFELNIRLSDFKLIGRSYRDNTKGFSGSIRILMESQKVFSIQKDNYGSWFSSVHLSPFTHRKSQRVYFGYFTDRLGSRYSETLVANGPKEKPEGYPQSPVSDVIVKPGKETPFFENKDFHSAYYEFSHKPDVITVTSRYKHKKTGEVMNVTYKLLIANDLLRKKSVYELKKMVDDQLAYKNFSTLKQENLLAAKCRDQKVIINTKQERPGDYFAG